MKTLPLIIPYPPVLLSPNQRPHWAQKSRAKATYRFACRVLVEEQLRWLGQDPERELMLRSPRLLFEVCAYRAGRTPDKDNLIASLKSGLDGVADALGVDDERFDTGRVQFALVDRKVQQQVLLVFSAAAPGARVANW